MLIHKCFCSNNTMLCFDFNFSYSDAENLGSEIISSAGSFLRIAVLNSAFLNQTN